MQIEMTYKKSTKNTYVFEATGTAIPTLYIQKNEFEKQPSRIVVTVKAVENDFES